MINQQTLENLIRENINLRPVNNNWHTCKGQCCNDYKQRASFKFDNGIVGYFCFNCSSSAKYEEFSGKISKNFRRILNAYNIEDSEISGIVNSAFFNKKESSTITLANLSKISTATPTIQLPPKTFALGHPEFLDYQEKLISYLIHRKVDLDKYKFFFSLEERLINRIIIPFYRNNKLIYWQARSINDSTRRYENAVVSKSAVLFNYDQLTKYSNGPLLVTEGSFDAMMLDGVAILGSKLNDAKTLILQRSPRRLVFIIDKDKNGKHLAEDVLQKGWEITFTPYGTSDLNHSVQRFGVSYTIYEIMKSITKDSDAARLAININCR